jgi:hypothetical protein
VGYKVRGFVEQVSTGETIVRKAWVRNVLSMNKGVGTVTAYLAALSFTDFLPSKKCCYDFICRKILPDLRVIYI